eukprot:TRINITY_DN5301_c0_g1_i1.p1 TRINITY_DN5301_c0_g1~~TRINITY_DN5301_c0_g1_i1.p1  ORF type:complete len:151 (+),score=24.53 TRINITY_DN5301_c0_g1_i1:181-633(+)
MTTIPGDLVWEIVRNNNSFLVKQNGNSSAKVLFSSEPNNLYNTHSYKFSGLANKKTVSIAPGEGDRVTVVLATSKTKKQNKPASMMNRTVLKKDFRRIEKAILNQIAENNYRPDLKKHALARLSAVHKSLRVAKAGGKKKSKGTRRSLKK